MLASLVVYLGVEASRKSEPAMSFVMLLLFIVMAAVLKGKVENALYMGFNGVWAIIGVSIFALGYHSIPMSIRLSATIRR